MFSISISVNNFEKLISAEGITNHKASAPFSKLSKREAEVVFSEIIKRSVIFQG